jgi:hypothetical protein
MSDTITSMPNGDFTAEWTHIICGPAYITPTITITCHKTKRRFKYNPKEDITAFELSWLVQLFIAISSSHGAYNIDTDNYIVQHNLERHFEII